MLDGLGSLPPFAASPCNQNNYNFVNQYFELDILFFGIFIGESFTTAQAMDDSLTCFADAPLYGTLTTIESYSNLTSINLFYLISRVCDNKDIDIDTTTSTTSTTTTTTSTAYSSTVNTRVSDEPTKVPIDDIYPTPSISRMYNK